MPTGRVTHMPTDKDPSDFDGPRYGEPKNRTPKDEEWNLPDEVDFIAAPKVEEWIQKVAQEAADRTADLMQSQYGVKASDEDEEPVSDFDEVFDVDASTSADLEEKARQAKLEQYANVLVEEPKEEVEEDGLYFKYRIFKEPEDATTHPIEVRASYPNQNLGSSPLVEVKGFVFVLKPDSDHHARVALAAYAKSVVEGKPRLHDDLMEILRDLEMMRET